ncbi:MAG TPA: endonuclease/exonuclease/phosphatase family protein, partial [Gammaproteobacteria bacterium]
AGLARKLEDRSGVDWAHLCSHAIGRNSYKEAYCFLWRTDRVSYETGAVVYLDPDDTFAREPFSAVFRTDDDEMFLLATVHVTYGDSKSERRREGRALRDYRDWLAEAFPGTPLVLMGDFNLWPDDRSLAPLDEVATPLIVSGGTTLSSKDGRYANLYDHVWVSGKITSIEAGIRKIPVEFELSHEYVRRHVSDHVPVWARVAVER